MTVKELYQESIIHKHHSLLLLIDFLVNEKKVLKMDDDSDKLCFYLEDRFAERMKAHLNEYNQKRNLVPDSIDKSVDVYRIRKQDTYYFVAAYSKEQAESLFIAKHGEFHELVIETPELQVNWEGKLLTLGVVMRRTNRIPSILGCWKV